MASIKREHEYDANRARLSDAKKALKFGFILSEIISGAVFLILGIYYFIKALAGMAGATMIVGEYFASMVTGEKPNNNGLLYNYPYGFMAFLLLLAILSAAAFATKKRGYNTALLIFHALGALYGIAGLFAGFCDVAKGLYLVVCGCIGIWLELYLLGIHKEIDWLSLQEGYPDFIIALDEPHSMANTTGLTYKQSEFQKRKRQGGETKSLPQNVEMDELTVDTPLPKGSRKIDNML